MRKKILFLAFFVSSFIFVNCSQADDIKDTFDALKCLNELQKLQDNENETCEETINALKSLKKSCEDSEGSIQAYITLLETNCEDN